MPEFAGPPGQAVAGPQEVPFPGPMPLEILR